MNDTVSGQTESNKALKGFAVLNIFGLRLRAAARYWRLHPVLLSASWARSSDITFSHEARFASAVAKVTLVEHDLQLRTGEYRLEPMHRSHLEQLHTVLDSAMWGGMTTEYPGDTTALWEQLEPAIKAPDVMVFVALDRTRVVGSTRFYDIAPSQRRLEIGSTFYARSEWGSALNPACKLMLMEHAFETMQMHRVALRCDSRNTRSAGAIRRLGATAEGVLRGHRIDGTGTICDTAYFSVLQPEWPQVKSGLQRRLAT